MNIYLVDNGSTFTSYLEELLSQFGSVSVHEYDQLGNDVLEPEDLLILSGGHGLPVLWHEKEYHNEVELIKGCKGPIIGICLGFELLAHMFGSHLHLLEKHYKGEVSLKFTSDGEGLSGGMKSSVFESHRWSVRDLKKPLIALATSEYGVEIFRHENLPIYGLQFHPDGGRKDEGANILVKILADIIER